MQCLVRFRIASHADGSHSFQVNIIIFLIQPHFSASHLSVFPSFSNIPFIAIQFQLGLFDLIFFTCNCQDFFEANLDFFISNKFSALILIQLCSNSPLHHPPPPLSFSQSPDLDYLLHAIERSFDVADSLLDFFIPFRLRPTWLVLSPLSRFHLIFPLSFSLSLSLCCLEHAILSTSK